jgi:hypothetical protein
MTCAAGSGVETLRDEQRRRTARDQLADQVAARAGFQALVVIQFLVPEHLHAARVDQVQVADLVRGGDGVAGNLAFSARKSGEPAQLQAVAVVVVQPLDGQRGLQHGRFRRVSRGLAGSAAS